MNMRGNRCLIVLVGCERSGVVGWLVGLLVGLLVACVVGSGLVVVAASSVGAADLVECEVLGTPRGSGGVQRSDVSFWLPDDVMFRFKEIGRAHV